MIRVLHYGLSENRGGIETYLQKLWTNIDKNEVQFDFIDTNINEACFYNEFLKLGSNFYKVTPRSISIRKNKSELEQIFKSHKFNILHCHLNTLSYITPILIAIKYNCKVIIHSRSSSAPNSMITLMLHVINKIFMKLIIKKNKNNILKVAVSNNAGKWMYGNDEFVTINNSIDTQRYNFNYKKRSIIRENLKVNDGTTVVGHVGAFTYAKNHDYLIDVFKEYLKFNPNSRLVLVGDGPLRSKITTKIIKLGIVDKITLLGNINNIDEILCAMDLFVFPSIYEGFPNALIEAQACGLPCVISDKITDEAVILDDCVKLSVKESPQYWAKILTESKNAKNRDEASRLVEEQGLSISNEINKIMSLYSTETR